MFEQLLEKIALAGKKEYLIAKAGKGEKRESVEARKDVRREKRERGREGAFFPDDPSEVLFAPKFYKAVG